jgi:hypothetical protein
MRWLIALLVLVLAGCAQPALPPMTPEQQRQAAHEAAQIRDRNQRFFTSSDAMLAVAPALEGRDRQAAVICHERGKMAAAQSAHVGRGMAGAINSGLQQGWAGSEVEAACLRAYSATGVMPDY